MDKEENNGVMFNIDDLYDKIQKITNFWNNIHSLCYITSRSTNENLHIIENISLEIKNICDTFHEPIKDISFKKIELYINVFKYFICNTNFSSQLLLAEDTVNGYLVDLQPPLSPYLFIEILWNIGFEDILAESILYFPLDLCIDIFEVLPRCIELLDCHRESKFLATLIPNTYKKLIIMRDVGSQTEDIVQNSKRLTGNLQELILQFTSKRYIIKPNEFKRCGMILKIIIEMASKCFTSKTNKVELNFEMKKMYNLTFGWKPIKKLNDMALVEFLTEIDRELTTLLLKKVKEIDCNIYLNWTEYNDEQNTSLTLQQVIGLECHSFIENTKYFDYSNIQEYKHLIECLSELASNSNPKDNTEILQQTDLCHEVNQGNAECFINLFQTCKDWDTSLLTKDVCINLVENFAEKLDCEQNESHLETFQTNLFFFIKNLVHLSITELYEVTIKCVLKFIDNKKIQTIIGIKCIEKFITYNPNFSTSTNLKVILFFLCLKTKCTLKILLKILIGHSDYPNVAITLDDFMLLLPVLKIHTLSKYESIMTDLNKISSEEKKEFYEQWHTLHKKEHFKNDSETTALVVQILQEICLENPDFNTNKFINLLSALYSFCPISEIVDEIFIPLLMSCTCSCIYLKCILLELQKLINSHEFIIKIDLVYVLQRLAVYLYYVKDISKYTIDELMTLITTLNNSFYVICNNKNNVYCNDYRMYINFDELNLLDIIGTFMSLLQNKFFDLNKKFPINIFTDNILRYLFLKCSKEKYMKYTNEIIISYGNFFKWTNKSDIYNNIIRLTFETCLLCLEFPNICSLDNISFLIHCLSHLLNSITISKKNKKFYQKLCKSIDTQILIFEHSIKHTEIASLYSKLLQELKESNSNFKMYIASLKRFSFSCTTKGEKLKSFNGPHSDTAIKLWVGNEIINTCVNTFENQNNESYINELNEYFETIKL